MNGYFIHTIEFKMKLEYEDYKDIKKKLKFFHPDGFISKNYQVVCNQYKKNGILLEMHKCSDYEQMSQGGYKFRLIAIVNLSRFATQGSFINAIEDKETFIKVVNELGAFLEKEFWKCNRRYYFNDFKLHRVDVAKDRRLPSESCIRQFILLMRRIPMASGYKVDMTIEYNTPDFDVANSYNIINKSRGIEFVLYNKSHGSRVEKYNNEEQDYYTNTLRMEMKFKQKYITKHTKGMHTANALLYIYDTMADSVKTIYQKMYYGGINGCFVRENMHRHFVRTKNVGKEVRQKKMLCLMELCIEGRNFALNEIKKRAYMDIEKVYENVIKHYKEINLSPLTISNRTTLFIQSPDSLLGFEKVTKQERDYCHSVVMYDSGEVCLIEE